MTDRRIELWLFCPELNSRDPRQQLVARARDTISLECRARGWHFNRISTKIMRPEGRYVGAITPRDATTLYRSAHRARVGVWQICYAHAPIRPAPSKNWNHYMTLGRFLRYKAFHFNVGKRKFADVWPSSLISFQEWLKRVDCEGQSDPRCLPFHIFGSGVPVDDLATGEGRYAFANKHGSSAARLDDNHLRWKSPRGSLHGRERLQVSGRDLEKGFHWDVDSRKKSHTVTSTAERWKIQRGGYLNIYPDGYIREGKLAKRLYPTGKRKAH